MTTAPPAEPAQEVTLQALQATVARMEARLAALPQPELQLLWELYRGLVPRFEQDLRASERDIALARSAALMLIQARAQGLQGDPPPR